MSQSNSPVEMDKLRVILSICGFLAQEIENASSSDIQESLTVAIQCLEAAFGFNYADQINATTNVPNLWNALVPLGAQALSEAESFKQRGNIMMSHGCFQDAVNSYNRAIQLNPGNAIYYCNRGAAYYRLGNYSNSVADCEAAVRLDPNYGKAYGRLGLAFLTMNLYGDAMEAYTSAVRLDPANTVYKQNFELAMANYHSSATEPATGIPSTSEPQETSAGDSISTTTMQSAVSQIVNNPNLLNMATEMLSDESVRNAMTGLIQMRAQSGGNPSMENLLLMGQQLAQQMQQQHPDFIETLRCQFGNENQNASSSDQSSDKKDEKDQPPGSRQA